MSSTSPWLDNSVVRGWVASESLRRNDPGRGLLDDFPPLVGAVAQVHDTAEIDRLIAAERRRNPVLDRWFEDRFISTYTVAELGTHAPGTLGRLLHDYMVEHDLTLELLPQRQADPDWVPESDWDYYTLRSGQTHDFDHLIGESGFDVIGEVFPAGLRTGNIFAHVAPELAGKLDGTAIRIPTPNVSLVSLDVNLAKTPTKDEINATMLAASEGALKGILAYNKAPLVSIDFNHNPASCTFDATQTAVVDGAMVRVMGWYDNEWGFSNRMSDTAALFGSL